MTEPAHAEPDHPGRLVPPWDEPTVRALNAFQRAGRLHPFTCARDSSHILIATREGWKCGYDDYAQTWAHAFMVTLAGEFPPLPWHVIEPVNAAHLELPAPWIQGPLNEDGEPCPWPWDPQQRVGVPIGMFHCRYCGAMCVAGFAHPDYRDDPDDVGATGEPGETSTHGVIQQ